MHSEGFTLISEGCDSWATSNDGLWRPVAESCGPIQSWAGWLAGFQDGGWLAGWMGGWMAGFLAGWLEASPLEPNTLDAWKGRRIYIYIYVYT